MARKTTGSTAPKRVKKTEVPVAPADVQVAPAVQAGVHSEVRKDVPQNGKSANLVPANIVPAKNVPVNLEDEIRRRAYELYLQRRATAGAENGNQNQDWLMAESEIRLRYGRLARHTTA